MDERPAALLLDLDDTLLDHGGLAPSLVRACEELGAAGLGLDPVRLLDANRRVWLEYWPTVEVECWLGKLEGFAVSREAWRRTLAACGCDDEGTATRAFEVHRVLGRAALRLFDDVGDLLAAATELGIALAVVTNGPSDLQRDKLDALGLADRFDAVVISGELGTAKPDPAAFRRALDDLGVDAAAAWHVGDSLTTDVAGARAAGIRAVWLDRTGAGEADPAAGVDLRIASLRELVAGWARP